jgi:hypothetical protein
MLRLFIVEYKGWKYAMANTKQTPAQKVMKGLRAKKRVMENTDEKELMALELRKLGMTFDQIAAKVGWANRSVARNAVNRALDKVVQEKRTEAEELLKLELYRLDSYLLRLEDSMSTASNVQEITSLTDAMLKIQDKRSKLMGLYAPVKSEAEVNVYNHEEVLDELA